MMISQIIQILSKYMLVGITGCIISASIFLIVYFSVYKKIMKGENKLNLSKIGLYSAFIIYMVMVIEVTIISRDPLYGGIPIEVFTSYKNAIYSGECTNIILNIFMFVPLGFILPLLWKRCKKWYVTYLLGLFITLTIEIVQLITMRGIFEVDDIINNFLGCAIGYGLVMTFTLMFKKRNKILSIIIYQIPLILTITGINLMLQIYYNIEKLSNIIH